MSLFHAVSDSRGVRLSVTNRGLVTVKMSLIQKNEFEPNIFVHFTIISTHASNVKYYIEVFIDRPGVAGAVLHTASLLIN